MSAAGEPLRDSAVFNLTGAVTMVVDDSPFSMEVTIQALQGFGIRTKHTPRSTAQAMELLKLHSIDLLFIDCEMEGSDGHGLVRWLRRSGLEPNAFVPVIMTASHVRRSRVADVRDCGANFLVTKPFSPPWFWNASSGSRVTTGRSSRPGTIPARTAASPPRRRVTPANAAPI